MLVMRCTGKLLKKMGAPIADPPPSTTVLGDWYVNLIAIFAVADFNTSRAHVLLRAGV